MYRYKLLTLFFLLWQVLTGYLANDVGKYQQCKLPELTHSIINTNTCTTSCHRLKFIKNHLKNSYMFRSTTIFRES